MHQLNNSDAHKCRYVRLRNVYLYRFDMANTDNPVFSTAVLPDTDLATVADFYRQLDLSVDRFSTDYAIVRMAAWRSDSLGYLSERGEGSAGFRRICSSG